MVKELDITQELIEDEIAEEAEEEAREDAMEDDMDAQNDLQREIAEIEASNAMPNEENQNVLGFLRDVLESPDRFKTANLTWEELGKPTFSTRFWLNLSNTCTRLFKMPLVSEYCLEKAKITTDTSLSREGFMVQTSVTQKKVKERRSSSDLAAFLKNK